VSALEPDVRRILEDGNLAHLATVLRVLFQEVFDRTVEGEKQIADAVWPAAELAFDQLEPVFGGY